MRIALFADTYPEDVNGVAKTLGKLVAHSASRGHEVALITTRVSQTPDPAASLHRQIPGIPAPMYPELQLARLLDRRTKRMLRDFDPDIVHVATESTVGFSGRRWALRNGIPLVTSFHTNFPVYVRDYVASPLESFVWKYLRWFHACSLVTFCPSRDTLAELTARSFHPRLRVWGRGVDTELYGPHRRSRKTRERIAPGAEHILVYVGRLATEKRVDLLMDAFVRIRTARGADTALVLVGDGPAAGRLRARSIDGVHFTGFLHGVPLAEVYAAGDLFVFASDTETFGNVVLEAIASGLPAVVVDKGGVRESAIPGWTGVRVPAGDPDAFARACLDLLDDEPRRSRLAEGARAEALARRWDDILDDVLAEYEAVRSSPETSSVTP